MIHDREAVIGTLEEFIGRLGLATARKLPVGLPADHAPTPSELRAVPPNATFVHFKIQRTPDRTPTHAAS